ncbi:1-acyl-sn-glycerol-3-phosphate acyltransferase [Mycobacterium avium subsp. hominissuis]|jgi:1-acyl-sn-glycerol-3-phosphate acyltransferase|uniref:1-acyl-sn-glycerol-3-phosphate acyltransferase n=11 Tax=Mycobacterium avium complex (MAC) TaxID=120793 RepID=A0AAW5S134_MYCBC|nr:MULTISPECIES: lysophospholipid acyltransferase family protein [Mycobacterium avium complex (MAC)]TXA42917.1 1-acyl-sn-glycerol-3-phosphate acyltransferase [Mycobacterium tuberculosis variant bovis]APA77032.1 1-acyl-sn-glycerol-3-phosphate acyltransferase [Mycobacterium avium subsp. hominissuis]ATO63806.1 1-acyl-sn-glycerol-3-phosphate acyltransferase [Mycobacterium avium subsp. hominissuis]ATO68355.1 1-acyl-sn-glycerol-3-phosphate acyltransferase [Mycobacterium avium subsp. hominissuis]ATO7
MQAPAGGGHSWLPRASCDARCVAAGRPAAERRLRVVVRVTLRLLLAVLLAPGWPLLAVPLPGRTRVQRIYCRLVLRCFGVRITVSGNPIRNLRGVLVVSPHTSWLDVFAIGAVLPGSFVARADMFSGPATGVVARILKIIPIERSSLRRLPGVVDAVAHRLRAGQTVVAFPEGTTWCGRDGDDAGGGGGPSHTSGDDAGRGAAGGGGGPSHRGRGAFYPAMFQAAIDAGRPVQPLRLTYQHVDGSTSTAPAFVGDETLLGSIRRLLTVRRTLARVQVESLQLPGTDRRALAGRCQSAVGVAAARRAGHGRVLVA